MKPQGIITKIYTDSFFLSFHQNSKMADNLFSAQPKHSGKSVDVYQVMMLSEERLIAEVRYIPSEKEIK